MRITRKDLDLLAEAYNTMADNEDTADKSAEGYTSNVPRSKFRFRGKKRKNVLKKKAGDKVGPPREKLKFFSQDK